MNTAPPLWQTHLRPDAAIDDPYHDNARPYVAELFSRAPTKLLDIGCGTGATCASLRKLYPDCRMYGIETNAEAAKIAETRLDHVFCCEFEKFDPNIAEFPNGQIDAVLMLDVLEHMYNPWQALVHLKSMLAPSAQVLASIPNARNLWLLAHLAGGNWTYADHGLLDITHIRFFTLREIRRMFDETGYRSLRLSRTRDNRVSITVPAEGQRIDVETEVFTMRGVTREVAMDLITMQFVIVAEPA